MQMFKRLLCVLALVCVALRISPAQTASAAGPADGEALKKSAPKVFIDCSGCDIDYIRTEITFVNYVRDRKDAQVHVLITTQPTGSSGTEYTMEFSGQEAFKGIDNSLKYVSGKTDTQDEIRAGLVRTLKIGLVPYAGRTPVADRLSISYQDSVKPTSVDDPWDFWVFSVSGRGYFEGEKMARNYYINGSFSANRVTPAFKFRASYSASRSTDRFYLTSGAIISTSKNHNINLLAVKSLTDHWSVGAGLSAYSSTYSNINFAIQPAPAVEYNFFPYSESTRRQLRFLWKPGYHYYRYREETIYEKTSEGLWGENYSIAFEMKEKWGTVSTEFEAFHYFSDLSKNHLSLYTELSVRVFKGLSFNIYGSFQRIRDRLSLVKGDASLEEVLLRRTQLATSYSYYSSVGLSYSFGSIFSNVVNPRFNGY
jgi:hypothetical protein